MHEAQVAAQALAHSGMRPPSTRPGIVASYQRAALCRQKAKGGAGQGWAWTEVAATCSSTATAQATKHQGSQLTAAMPAPSAPPAADAHPSPPPPAPRQSHRPPDGRRLHSSRPCRRRTPAAAAPAPAASAPQGSKRGGESSLQLSGRAPPVLFLGSLPSCQRRPSLRRQRQRHLRQQRPQRRHVGAIARQRLRPLVGHCRVKLLRCSRGVPRGQLMV